ALLASSLLDRILGVIYENDHYKKVVAKSMITECIVGHMATQKIYSLEAGSILIADGCDMEKGRARIPMMLHPDAKVGDIHKYSSSAVESVKIGKGENRPIRITVEMNESVGFFQIEEVLFRKINSSSIKPYIELYAGVIGKEMKCYL
ncbi:MAG TPA: phosphohydrolase, partial [Candidatus Wallbacteria bacterium]|nr:phosphohydrolase [Candidatus Wallbacteria bacterium]